MLLRLVCLPFLRSIFHASKVTGSDAVGPPCYQVIPAHVEMQLETGITFFANDYCYNFGSFGYSLSL